MRTWGMVLVAAAVAATAGCIAARCLRDADCGSGLVCNEATNACVAPQCSVDSDCPHGNVCEQRFCVTGCASEADCTSNEACVSRRCLRIGDADAGDGGGCTCPLAPTFCGTDINPASTTFGTELCVPRDFPDGVALFFGNVGCSHCYGIMLAMQARKAQLVADGLAPRMVWVQLKDFTWTPTDVAAHLGTAIPDAVIQDTTDLGIWEAYAGDWYHIIMVDAHGCRLTDFGPLDGTMVDGDTGDRIVAEWRDAMDPYCPAAP